MSRKFQESNLLVATRNAGKLREFKKLFAQYPFTLLSALDFDVDAPEETGGSFLENAIIKAQYYSKISGITALSDDSGLSIPYLGGAPGVYSARFAGSNRNYQEAALHLHEMALLKAKNNNEELGDRIPAKFICSLAICWPDGHVEECNGELSGTFLWEAKGSEGFGYDPFFIPENETLTLSELGTHYKNRISHRGNAFRNLIEMCF